MKRILPVVVLILAICLTVQVPLGAQQAVPLAFKFSTGDKVHYVMTFSGSGGLTSPDGALSPLGVQGSLDLLQEVIEARPDGSGRLETKIASADFNLTIAKERVRFTVSNGTIRWYTNGKEQVPPQGDLSKLPLIGIPLVMTMAANGRVSDVTLPDPKFAAMIQQIMPGLNPAQLQSPGETVFPDKPVNVGEEWGTTTNLTPFGPGFPITIRSTRRLGSFEEQGGIGLAKITGYNEIKLRTTSAFTPPNMQGVAISVPELRQTLTSTEFFNTTRGQLVRGDYDLSFSTRISAKLAEQEQTGGVEARFRFNVQVR